MSDANLYTAIDGVCQRMGDKPALMVPGGATLTYRGLADAAARYAGALVAAGVKPGDRVMVQAEKSAASVALYLGTLRCGAVYNPLNTAYTPAELDYFLGDAEPRIVVVSAATRAKIASLPSAACAAAIETLEADGSGTMADRAAAASAAPMTARTGGDLAALLYTSGTTGRSKGAMITHDNLVSNARALIDIWGFSADDRLLHALPIFHVHGLFVALHTALLSGASMHWLAKFDIGQVLDLLPQSTVMMGVPTFYTRLLGEPNFGSRNCASMRLFVSGSAPLLAETHVAFKARTGFEILERYGMTETGMITSNPYAKGERVAGTVGYALPGVSVRVASPEGVVLPKGEIGVIEVKGPNVFTGYWRNPEKTKEDFRDDSWFITGDVGQLAADGRVTIVGRAKDLVISGGYNVYPIEIETELNTLPGVIESAVIGVPHPDFGEAVVAVVARSKGSVPPAEADLVKALGERLAKFKLPKRVLFVDDLPRNAMGKVQKAELRKTYDGLFKR
jgi:malonyl-CoA/methylmalonyl-CoA synthetase